MNDEAWYDLSTYDGRRRAFRAIQHSALSQQLKDALLPVLAAGAFPKRKGRAPKPVHEQLRDEIRGLAQRGPGTSAADAGARDRIYRPNRKRAAAKK